MDTVYYNLNARRVKVSGGPDLMTFVPTPVAAPAGEVLDFARCRQKLETKAAFQNLKDAAWETAPVEEEPVVQDREGKPGRFSDLMELCASASVVLTGLAASVAFFALI